MPLALIGGPPPTFWDQWGDWIVAGSLASVLVGVWLYYTIRDLWEQWVATRPDRPATRAHGFEVVRKRRTKTTRN